jgi:iron(III) transport system ATP-binding protein
MITLRNLTKSFVAGTETVLAMDDLTLDVENHCFFTLLGPSGCGKSTLLRCVAGLETPTSGEIGIGNKSVFSSATGLNVSPAKRHIGMVFQSYAIWPHMTVFKNVSFPLEVQNQDRIKERTMHALSMVGLENLAERYASRLSGGQQQRIAFARAVVAEPDLLLLDEPLSNLDAALREQMRSEMRKMQERLKVTTLYVTHDQAEALSMSDRIAVMREGRFVEIATPEELYNKPKTAFTAQFLGGANILEGTVKEAGSSTDGTAVHTDFGVLWTSETAPAGPAKLFLRPEKVSLDVQASQEGQANVFSWQVTSRRFVGDSRELELSPPGTGDDNVIRCKSPAEFEAATGSTLSIHIDPTDVHLLDNI